MRKRTTIDLDQDLVREAAAILGTTRTTDTVHAALSDVVRSRRRMGLLEVPTDLQVDALDSIRSHRFAVVPGRHRRSLAGALRGNTRRQPADETWEALRRAAWEVPDPDRRR